MDARTPSRPLTHRHPRRSLMRPLPHPRSLSRADPLPCPTAQKKLGERYLLPSHLTQGAHLDKPRFLGVGRTGHRLDPGKVVRLDRDPLKR